ncbi:MAG: hypothetical protein IJH12_08155 [Clostridia bacterium]|nr:hypothetical protein [Clostridia bacterium]
MYHTKLKEDAIYLKKISKVKKTPEYIQNQMQIDCIKKVLIEHSDVPEKLIDWLIQSVEQNATLIATIQKEYK